MNEDSINEYTENIKKLASIYGMGIFTQFIMEERGFDVSNQQMLNLQLLDQLRQQAKILVSNLDTGDNGGL